MYAIIAFSIELLERYFGNVWILQLLPVHVPDDPGSNLGEVLSALNSKFIYKVAKFLHWLLQFSQFYMCKYKLGFLKQSLPDRFSEPMKYYFLFLERVWKPCHVSNWFQMCRAQLYFNIIKIQKVTSLSKEDFLKVLDQTWFGQTFPSAYDFILGTGRNGF